MIRLAISVEGDTEEEFVKYVLADYLRPCAIEAIPYLLTGNVNADRLGGEMARHLRDHDAVTSLVDLYGFVDKRHQESATQLENRVSREVRRNLRMAPDPLFAIPYVQQYEFEGLLFADPAVFGTLPGVSESALEQLRGIRQEFTTPEDINDSPLTAPSKRIASIIPRYNKKVHGPLLAEAIGLDQMRDECPRFNRWLANLEALAQ